MSSLLSQAEENYLKAIFTISRRDGTPVSNQAISQEMNTSAASVTDMLRRLNEKELVLYKSRKGVSLTPAGQLTATLLVRKHRLWETFLVEKLAFTWDEVHELAEQLEHIQSNELVERLAAFLGHPKYDPHGDPIPDANGQIAQRVQVPLSQLNPGQTAVVVGVRDHTPAFLKYLERTGLTLGVSISITERLDYDDSLGLLFADGQHQLVSLKVSQNLYVQEA